MTRTRSVPLALAVAAACQLAAPAASLAADADLTCSASAARVLNLAEPVRLAGECTTRSRQLASFGTGLLSVVEARVTALHASTVRSGDAPGAVTSTALADRVRIALPGLVVEAANLRATADASCVDGRPALATGGALGTLTVNGQARQIGSAPFELDLGIARLRLNHTEARDGGVVRRALQLTSLLGDVAVGEAQAGTSGEPCRSEPDPEPAPDSELTKAVDAADGSRVTARDAQPGEAVTYRLTYVNEGDAPAQDVVVTDVLDRQSPGACEPQCTQDGATVRWELGDVGPGETRELSLQSRLPATADQAGTAVFRNAAVAQDHTGTAASGEVQVRVPYQPRIVVEHTHRPWFEGSPEPSTEPIVLEEIHYGGWGFGSDVVLRNEGTAPATDLELTSPMADAFAEPECFQHDGDGCTVEPDAAAPRVMDPAQTGFRARWRKASLAIGETAQGGFGGQLHGGDYAQAETDLSLQPVLHTAQGDVEVPRLQVTVLSSIDVAASAWGYSDEDGNGDVEWDEYLGHDEAVPVGRAMELTLGANALGGRAAHDVEATAVLPAGFEVLGDPCAEASPEVTCTYTPATRTLRLTAARLSGQEGQATVTVRGRAALPKGRHAAVVETDYAEGDASVEDVVFRVV